MSAAWNGGVDKLENDMAAIAAEQISQNARTSAVEDDLAVHRAAEEVKAAKERRNRPRERSASAGSVDAIRFWPLSHWLCLPRSVLW